MNIFNIICTVTMDTRSPKRTLIQERSREGWCLLPGDVYGVKGFIFAKLMEYCMLESESKVDINKIRPE
jgi:hypothetical protein